MDWNDTPEQSAFRDDVRAFIDSHVPPRYQRDAEGYASPHDWQHDSKSEDSEARRVSKEWITALGERGWMAPHWPKEYGGAGLSPMEQFIYKQEMTRSEVPQGLVVGPGMIGPTLIIHGTEEQKKQHLPKIVSGEVLWAQGYSEPEAGSDLASLKTRAVRDGDEYVINGQKIWTTGAHYSDWLFALVRTDPDAPKHRGVSFLIMDINTPGISVRPLINMGWEHEFNETFFENVRVPVSNRIGEENRGWYVGMTLLDFERSNIPGAVAARRDVERLVQFARGADGYKTRIAELPSVRDQVADRYIESEVMYNFSLRIISIQAAGMVPNYEASVSKLFGSELSQRVANTGVKALGLYGNLWARQDGHAPMRSSYTRAYVRTVPSTIAGGSSEIQRGIIAGRGLGLPRG